MPPKKATEPSPATAKTADEPKATASSKDDATYSDKASQLAADVAAFVQDARDRLTELADQVNDVQQTDATPDDAPVADGVRRVPMSTSDVERALDGLHAVAADLRQRTAS